MNSLFFPFTAIVGMDLARHSLIYHAIDQGLGGTVLMGHRGCAKSTMVRAFKDILVSGNSAQAPFVEVPLGASEERLLGSVDATLLVDPRGPGREPHLLGEGRRSAGRTSPHPGGTGLGRRQHREANQERHGNAASGFAPT